jgi:hypothetical protein
MDRGRIDEVSDLNLNHRSVFCSCSLRRSQALILNGSLEAGAMCGRTDEQRQVELRLLVETYCGKKKRAEAWNEQCGARRIDDWTGLRSMPYLSLAQWLHGVKGMTGFSEAQASDSEPSG